MKNETIIEGDFGNISRIYGVSHIGNEFMLIYNLDDNPNLYKSDSDFTHYPVKITNFVVIFCVKGIFTVNVNLNVHNLTHNTSLTIMPGAIVEVGKYSDDAIIAVMLFSNEYFLPYEHMEEFISIGNMIRQSPMIRLDDITMGNCIEIYRKMKEKLLNEDNPFRKFALKAYSHVLCATALEQLASKSASKLSISDRPMELYNRFMELVKRDFRKHRTIKHYANTLGISPKYFSLMIKKVSGKTAREWIDEHVLLEARMLLKSRRYTIQQVSDMLSFANQSFFAKYFKSHTGFTPSGYQTSN